MNTRGLVEKVYAFIFPDDAEGSISYRDKLIIVLFSLVMSTWILVIILKYLIRNILSPY